MNESTLGSYIAARREELRITQQELAERLRRQGIDRAAPTIAHWENDRQKVPVEFLNVLALVLEEPSPVKLYKLAGILVNLPGWEINEMLDGVPAEDVDRIKRQVAAYFDNRK